MRYTDQRPIITHEQLRELVDYDPDTGLITWLIPRRARGGLRNKGDSVGIKCNTGYIKTTILGRTYLVHRLIWFFVTGEYPTHDIDHINGIRDDNRACNLRDASKTINAQNQRRAQCNNTTSGLLGAWPKSNDPTKWRSAIMVCGKIKFLGYFSTAEAAHAAYLKAKRELHEGCTI